MLGGVFYRIPCQRLSPTTVDKERVPKMSDQRLCVLRCRASVGMSKRFIRTYSSSCVDEYYNYYVLLQLYTHSSQYAKSNNMLL